MEEQWDSLWGHLDALQRTFMRSLGVVGIGFVCLLTFYQPIFHFFTANPIEMTREGLKKDRVQRFQITNHTSQNQLVELPSNASLVAELSSGVVKKDTTHYLLLPGQFISYEEVSLSPLLIMGPIEGLILVIKGCFWISIVFTAPLWGWIWLRFILPAANKQERAILIPFLVLSLFCICLGMAGAYFVTLPLANNYLSLFNQSLGQNAWTLTHYVNYVLFLCAGHAVAAEIALLLFMAVHFRLLSPGWLIAKRRHMIVAAFIIGALLTPPDVLTQFLMAIPLIVLYELAIWYAKWRATDAYFVRT